MPKSFWPVVTLKRITAMAVFILSIMAVTVICATPEWITDPANSRWILFGGATGVAETNGITFASWETGEGTLSPINVNGVSGAQSLRTDGSPGFYYLVAEPWEKLRTWIGDKDILLTIRYFDGGPGTLFVRYDSSDQRFKFAPLSGGRLAPT